MLGTHCRANSRGVVLLGPLRGLRLGPYSLGCMLGILMFAWVLCILWRSGLVCYSCSICAPGVLRLGFALVGLHSLCLFPLLVGPCFPCFVAYHSSAIPCLEGPIPSIGPLVRGCC